MVLARTHSRDRLAHRGQAQSERKIHSLAFLSEMRLGQNQHSEKESQPKQNFPRIMEAAHLQRLFQLRHSGPRKMQRQRQEKSRGQITKPLESQRKTPG